VSWVHGRPFLGEFVRKSIADDQMPLFGTHVLGDGPVGFHLQSFLHGDPALAAQGAPDEAGKRIPVAQLLHQRLPLVHFSDHVEAVRKDA
jgi:hypothetical protein